MTEAKPPRARLFVAVQPDPAAVSGIERTLAPMREEPTLAKLRWVAAEKLHFTLRFLGSVPLEQAPAIAAACAAITADSSAFQLTLSGAGAFPSPRRATVLWIGASDGAAALVDLAGRLNARLDALGFAREERAFKPHLTIARNPKPSPLVAAVESLASIRIVTPVRDLLLVRSHLGRPSSRYEVLERFALGEAG